MIMRAYQQRQLRQKLELIPEGISQSLTESALRLLNAFRRSLQTTWLPSNEPRIWQSQDAHGNPQWKAYDPRHDRTLTFHAEQDLLTWLEERPYRVAQQQASFWGI